MSIDVGFSIHCRVPLRDPILAARPSPSGRSRFVLFLCPSRRRYPLGSGRVIGVQNSFPYPEEQNCTLFPPAAVTIHHSRHWQSLGLGSEYHRPSISFHRGELLAMCKNRPRFYVLVECFAPLGISNSHSAAARKATAMAISIPWFHHDMQPSAGLYSHGNPSTSARSRDV